MTLCEGEKKKKQPDHGIVVSTSTPAFDVVLS